MLLEVEVVNKLLCFRTETHLVTLSERKAEHTLVYIHIQVFVVRSWCRWNAHRI